VFGLAGTGSHNVCLVGWVCSPSMWWLGPQSCGEYTGQMHTDGWDVRGITGVIVTESILGLCL
jgi:hypothetical protein